MFDKILSRHFQKKIVFHFFALFKFFLDKIFLKVENIIFSYVQMKVPKIKKIHRLVLEIFVIEIRII